MAQITANFGDRDSANLTLMRLRRGGIDFDLISLSTPSNNGDSELGFGITYPISFSRQNNIPTASLNSTHRSDGVYADVSPTEMNISVKSSHLQKAWDVMRSCGAKDIRSRN